MNDSQNIISVKLDIDTAEAQEKADKLKHTLEEVQELIRSLTAKSLA